MRKKRFALVMAVLFALTIVLPLFAAPAFASTSYTALSPKTIGSSPSDAQIGTLYIKIDPMAGGTSASALVTLPTDFDVDTGSIGVVGASVTAGVYRDGFDDNEFRVDIANGGTTVKAEVTIPLYVTARNAKAGDIVATITSLSGQLVSGSVVLGTVSRGAVTVTAGTVEYIAGSGNYVTLTIEENAAGALKEANDSVKLTLPKGFEWGSVRNDRDLAGSGLVWDVDVDNNNERVLLVDVDAESSDKSIIRFEAAIIVDELDAKHGDVEVTIGGKSSVSPSKLVVAKYGDFGFKLDVEDATEFFAGRMNEEIGEIIIEETSPGSFIPGRAIYLTLPNGAKWAMDSEDIAIANVSDSDVDVTVGRLSNSDRTLRLIIDSGSDNITTKAGEIRIEDAEVNTAVNFKGDLTVEISGSAGVKGEVVVAKVLAPITVSADKPNVKIGVQGQAAGDIVITESDAEALIKGEDLYIDFSVSGAFFDATPKAEVTEGDIEVTLKKSSDRITLEIDSESTVASSIKISGITYTVNRSFPEGDVELKFSGPAVDEVNYEDDAKLFDSDRTAAKVVNAICVTPAPGDAKQTATFVIGSTTYTVDGVEQTMDVAPYVKDGRTYLPVRYVAYALGVAENNIMWDSATGTVTMIKGDKVVQVTVGSKNMVINGATIAMDAAPEINNGRTMLPFRWIAWAFGANVEWDGATQTVTMEL